MFRKILIAMLFNILVIYAQPQKYFIYFTDKSSARKANWQEIAASHLSQRALERRQRLGIPLDWFDLPVDENYVAQVESLGAQIVHRLKWLNAVSVRCEPTVLNEIHSLPYVVWTTKVKTMRGKIPQIIKIKGVEPGESFYGSAYQQENMLGVPAMHAAGYRGEGIRIGMLDSGFDLTQSAFDTLIADGRLIAKFDFVHNDTSVGYDSLAGDWDLFGYQHGTATLSCIAAYVPYEMVGVAPGAEIALAKTEIVDTMGVDFERRIEEDNWAAGIEWLDSLDAEIITSSLGYSDFQGDSQDYSFDQLNGDYAITTVAADFAASRGIAVFNSAGNERGSGWNHIIAPADGDSVCAIGAVNFDGSYASFSSPGPTADGRIKPDLAAPGAMVTVWSPDAGAPSYSNGTSFSCPITAGSAALALQALRETTPSIGGWNLIETIKSTADQYDSPDNDYGWGIPKMPIATGIFDGVYGIVKNASSDELIVDAEIVIGNDTILTDARGRFCVYIPVADTNISVSTSMTGYFSEDTIFAHRERQQHYLNIMLTPVVGEIHDVLCYPNPFTDSLTICWKNDDQNFDNAYVCIFSASGKLVREMPVEKFDEYGHLIWDGKNNDGKSISAGIYIVVVQIEKDSECCVDVKTHKIKILCVR
ncbi:S8 family peptidase [bacterium]|nr:S8 family peptidase [bacterium]